MNISELITKKKPKQIPERFKISTTRNPPFQFVPTIPFKIRHLSTSPEISNRSSAPPSLRKEQRLTPIKTRGSAKQCTCSSLISYLNGCESPRCLENSTTNRQKFPIRFQKKPQQKYSKLKALEFSK